MKKFIYLVLSIFLSHHLMADDGHQLWLKTKPVKPVAVVSKNKSELINKAIQELKNGWQGKVNAKVELIFKRNSELKSGGFKLSENSIEANTEIGLLYGIFELLRQQNTQQSVNYKVYNPSYQNRILNHWDNLDGTIERGYAGNSIFWKGDANLTITQKEIKLWQEYARANASIGINGAVLNNVNASPKILSKQNLQRVKAIADELRAYGIKTYLSVNFSSPASLGGLNTSDPFNLQVRSWWEAKAKEIYALVPDFGGFLVKANSEGQPGPQDFGRTHADGANMMADVLKPYSGIVMWRAFVYSPNDKDRAKQAYNEFMPLDGQFKDNVIIQVKNGPIDFQPREPFSPLFGAMKKNTTMPEVQITQEYLGHANQLAFLATMWEEFLKSDTYQAGENSTVAKTMDGSIFTQKYSAIAGVANIGLADNWCGYNFGQANWFAFGRLAWDNNLSSEKIADEWLKLTFKPQNQTINEADLDNQFLTPVRQMMLNSWEAVINYSMPLGLHHIFSAHHHFGPGPWWAPKDARPDWTPPYYHQADDFGVGFNRTTSGSNATNQYHEPLASKLNDLNTCPEKYLLWFHHVSWNHQMKSGKTLWDELCYRYNTGVNEVRNFQKTWDKLEQFLDKQHFTEMQNLLKQQAFDAQVYKDASLLYFQQFSKKPIPYDLERPIYQLDYLQKADPRLIYQGGSNYKSMEIR